MNESVNESVSHLSWDSRENESERVKGVEDGRTVHEGVPSKKTLHSGEGVCAIVSVNANESGSGILRFGNESVRD